jgi:hypothetical protein
MHPGDIFHDHEQFQAGSAAARLAAAIQFSA